MYVAITKYLDENFWREFVDRHPQGNIFHTPEMFQVFERARGHSPLLQAALDENNRVLALLLPVQVTLKNGTFRRLTTRSIAYGGVLCASDSLGKTALPSLLNIYIKSASREALFTEIRNLSDMSSIQPLLSQCGFIYEDHLDYLIDLNKPPEQVLQTIGSRTRKHIRQGLRKGNVKIELITDYNQLNDWYELICKSYREARVPLADRSLFEAAYDILKPKGMVQFWLGSIGSNYVAASAELVYKDIIYGWYSGVDRSFASELPGEMLMWHVLSWGAQNGYKTYDFGGAGKPSEAYGVRDFKAKFGGQLVSYGRYTLVHSPTLLHFSEKGYQFYRQLIGRF